MTREQFIKKWLANPQKQYTEYFKDEMREDLDLVIKMALKKTNVIGSVCDGCKFDKKCNLQDQGFFKEICRYFEQTDR